jgi:hypothetical protein
LAIAKVLVVIGTPFGFDVTVSLCSNAVCHESLSPE